MGFSIAAIASVAAAAYPILDALAHEHNSKKAAELRRSLNVILSKNNVKINQLRSELERKGLNYNLAMEALNGTSRAGRGFQIKRQVAQEYDDSVKKTNQAINELQRKSEQTSAVMEGEAQKLDASGIKTMLGDYIK